MAKCECCGIPYTESIEERRAMRLASLMVRLMRRRGQARKLICDSKTFASVESRKAGIRSVVAFQRYQLLFEKFKDLLYSVARGPEHWITPGGAP